VTPPAPADLAFRNGGGARRRTGGLLLRAAALCGGAVLAVVAAAALLLRRVRGSPVFEPAAVSAPGVIARNSTVHATSHRTAVADRMYNGALHRDFLGSLQLLDPEVLYGIFDTL